MDERIGVRKTSSLYDGILSSWADESQVGQRNEDRERKQEHDHIITLLEEPEILN